MSVKQKVYSEKKRVKPLVGDDVEIEILDEAEKTGNIVQILPRMNELIRPAVANIDQAAGRVCGDRAKDCRSSYQGRAAGESGYPGR